MVWFSIACVGAKLGSGANATTVWKRRPRSESWDQSLVVAIAVWMVWSQSGCCNRGDRSAGDAIRVWVTGSLSECCDYGLPINVDRPSVSRHRRVVYAAANATAVWMLRSRSGGCDRNLGRWGVRWGGQRANERKLKA